MKIVATALAAAAAVFMACIGADAGPVRIGQVNDTQFACVFSRACSVTYDETVGDLGATDYGSVAGVYTRTLTGTAGSSAGTDTGYLYRLDLTGVNYGECIHGMVFGVSNLDQINYTGSGPTYVVVVTGWLGSIGVASADYNAAAGLLEIEFERYVCPGDTTYYVGFSSASAARTPVLVSLFMSGRIPIIQAKARVP